METIVRGGRTVQGFGLGEVDGHGGGGHGGHGHHGGGFRGRGLPGRWGWWGVPYDPGVELAATGPCARWGAPVTLPPGMWMAAQAALGASGFQPTVARGPDGVLYRFSVENSEIVVRPCASQVVGALGDPPSTGLAGIDVSVSPAIASLAVGATAGLLAYVLRAPLWGMLVVGAGAALVTNVSIDKAA